MALPYQIPVVIRWHLALMIDNIIFQYCDIIFSNSLDSKSVKRLEIALNSCARYVLNLKARSHLSDQDKKLILNTNLSKFYALRCCVIIYKLLNYDKFFCPFYLENLFVVGRSTRKTTRVQVHYKTKHFFHSFKLAGARLWNELPFKFHANPALGDLRSSFFMDPNNWYSSILFLCLLIFLYFFPLKNSCIFCHKIV